MSRSRSASASARLKNTNVLQFSVEPFEHESSEAVAALGIDRELFFELGQDGVQVPATQLEARRGVARPPRPQLDERGARELRELFDLGSQLGVVLGDGSGRLLTRLR